MEEGYKQKIKESRAVLMFTKHSLGAGPHIRSATLRAAVTGPNLWGGGTESWETFPISVRRTFVSSSFFCRKIPF